MIDCLDFLLNLFFYTDLFHHFVLLYRCRKSRLVHQQIKQLLQHFKMRSLSLVLSISDYLQFPYFILPFRYEYFAFNVLVRYGRWLNNFYEFSIWIHLHCLNDHKYDLLTWYHLNCWENHFPLKFYHYDRILFLKALLFLDNEVKSLWTCS